MTSHLNLPRSWMTRPVRLITAGLLAASTLFGSSLTSTVPTADASSSSSVYWGAYISGAPFTSSLMDNFESDAGKHMSIVHWGEAWTRSGATQEFQAYYMQRVRNRGSIPMLTWGSWDSSHGATQSNFQLADVYNGAYDSYIREWATDAKTWGHPYFLRFDHEMNGNWQFPWSEQINGNQPGDYVKAWRHVHDIFTSVGATNTTWVWCPNVSGSTTRALSALYPGDSYVDWTCMDGYNAAADGGSTWQSFSQIFSGLTYGGYNQSDTYQELLDLAPSKPIMIGEVSSSENGGSKANWITDMYSTQLKTRFSAVKAVVWTNWNDNPTKTWPIESSTASQSAFRTAIASSYYASNEFASLGSGVIRPLAGATASTTTLTLYPTADTFTSSSAKTSTAGGTSLTLRADKTGTDTAFLRFDLSSLTGKTITSATLRLRTSSESWAGSGATFDARLVNSTDWKEAYMSFSNTVPITSTLLGSLAAPSQPLTRYDAKLSASILQSRVGQRVSLALNSRSGDVLIISSRESATANEPQLVVTYK
jgi:beta-mannanase